MFTRQKKVSNTFCTTNPILQIFVQCVACKFTYGLCKKFFLKRLHLKSCGKTGNISLSQLRNKRVFEKKDSAACHHLLKCIISSTFEDFSVLCNADKKNPLRGEEKPHHKDIKESIYMYCHSLSMLLLNNKKNMYLITDLMLALLRLHCLQREHK